jgi:tRNA (adenine37-N6)-methyltransferase
MTKPGAPPPVERAKKAALAEIVMKPIGVIHTRFEAQAGTPIQASVAAGIEGTIDLDPALADGLSDLDGFSHVILIYAFHAARGFDLRLTPYLDTEEHGVFATRAPRRPNPIGISVVRLLGIEGPTVRVADVDMLDGTPLLDIKPFIPDFDHRQEVRTGWYGRKVAPSGSSEAIVADSRFDAVVPEDKEAGGGAGP